MKNCIPFIFLFLISGCSALKDYELSNYEYRVHAMPTAGLIAFYPFNGNANDETGNGNNGTVIGAILTNNRFGTPQRAYHFAGAPGSYINCGNGASWNFNDELTVSIWAMLGTVNGALGRMLGRFDNTSTAGWAFSYSPGGDQRLCLDIAPPLGRLESPSTLVPGVWYHLAFVYKSSSGLSKIFVDGNCVAQSNFSGRNVNYTLANLTLGQFMASGLATYLGRLDDIRIYHRALSDDEINILAHEDANGRWVETISD